MSPSSAVRAPPERVGRYTLHHAIASGGMATVYFGKLSGPVGFSRVVAIKRMHPRFASAPQFVAMFLDEATLASRVHHPNVVQTLDVVAEEGETFLVMDYVRGPSLSSLLTAALRAREPIPIDIAAGVLSGVLAGLHAAHEACDKKGQPLRLVHRDVSPHNVLVGADGVSRIMDFGVAKATRRLHVTLDGAIKGKLSYMAPEQLQGGEVDRRADLFAAGVVLWTTIAGRRLFRSDDIADMMTQVLSGEIPLLSTLRPDVPEAVEAAVTRALERDPAARFATAREFASALETAGPIASARAIGEWVQRLAGDVLAERDAVIAEIEDTEVGADAKTPPPQRASLEAAEVTAADRPGRPAQPLREPEASLSGAPTLELPRPLQPTVEESATQTQLALPKEPPAAPGNRRGALVLGAVLVAAVAGVALVANVARQGAPTQPDASSTSPAGAATGAPPGDEPSAAPPDPALALSTEPAPSSAPSSSAVTSSSAATAAAIGARPATAPRESRVAKPRAQPSARSVAPPAAPGDPGYLPPRP